MKFLSMSRTRIIILTVFLLISLLLVAITLFVIPNQFEWLDGNSHLGVLLEGKSFDTDSGIELQVAYLAGIPKTPYRNEDGFWFLPIYFGEHQSTGKPIFLTWFFGKDSDLVTFIKVENNKVPFDPSLTVAPSSREV